MQLLVMLLEWLMFFLLHAFKQPLELPGDNIKQPLRCIHTWHLAIDLLCSIWYNGANVSLMRQRVE